MQAKTSIIIDAYSKKTLLRMNMSQLLKLHWNDIGRMPVDLYWPLFDQSYCELGIAVQIDITCKWEKSLRIPRGFHLNCQRNFSAFVPHQIQVLNWFLKAHFSHQVSFQINDSQWHFLDFLSFWRTCHRICMAWVECRFLSDFEWRFLFPGTRLHQMLKHFPMFFP